ncbi:MAG: phosphoglycerate dehydrogenase [Lachnospiraceae bacterium]|jgi:D-3-phosphoglycerate dehydrogenase|nr:phosphoglycerate dehydrogenase [Lachnospiraceae bacterium]MCH4070098.1 phosphoglycerate dehydrogenase [Lachnospiraceae bacterium]MCH4108550.1 phosphoglycerate dehydrogenase [Lachnospiraceae bacterium]MCI1302669.1 phosphoglycerate dehydrogenase [Lachnospiraceae bacterium]MCI1331853.1 phosphoglycerate dehydrogenase [Lachnospiraceae bacterium]
MINVACLNNISEKGLALFTSAYNTKAELADADLVLVRSAKMHDMELPDKLLAIGRAGAGVNNIPLDKCAEAGIVVFNTPGANANAVKEEVIAAMLLGSRDYVDAMKWVEDNKEDANIAKDAEKAKKAFAGREIMGKKLGVIGLGAIGQLVCNAAVALGMEVLGYDPYLSVNAAWNLSSKVEHIEDVNEIYRQCDYITIHVPAMDSTKGMIGRTAFDQMKEGVVLINCARDTLVDEPALIDAVKTGRVAHYITDFATPGITGLEHTITFPHLGASTEEAEENCAKMAVRELRDYVENGNIVHSVNFPSCTMGVCHTASRVAVLHRNVPSMISRITDAFGDAGCNIANMSNQSKGAYAYTLLDLDSAVPQDVIEKIKASKDIIRVRVIK